MADERKFVNLLFVFYLRLRGMYGILGAHFKGFMQKFKVVTLGCRTNQYESQAYVNQLRAMGYTEAQEGEVADLCIVNTCTVTESADSHSRNAIRKLAKESSGKLVVTGCLAERLPEEMRKIEGVSHVVSNQKKEKLLSEVLEEDVPEFSIENFSSHTRAFVKVQDGCNSFCTYCIIPYVRGRSRSRPFEEIIKEVTALVSNGYKEVVLTGINVGDYEGGCGLADLVRKVDAIPGIKRVRVSSIDPDEVDENLSDAILHGKNTCHSMHIVLQSGSNVILKKMNRKYSRQVFLETVDRLKSQSPFFTFTTDVIVGFPGESELDFEDTLSIMRDVKFAKVHMFPYSDRQRTRAFLFPNKVENHIKQARKEKVLRLSEEMGFLLRQEYVGQIKEVLLESEERSHLGFLSGYTDNFLPVLVPKGDLSQNQLVQVELIENTPHSLIGRLCG